jgi:hypothetical protein
MSVATGTNDKGMRSITLNGTPMANTIALLLIQEKLLESQ